MAITSANNISGKRILLHNICHKQHTKVDLPSINKNKNIWQIFKIIIKDNIPHTPSKVSILERIIFPHTPEEAMSVGLAKA